MRRKCLLCICIALILTFSPVIPGYAAAVSKPRTIPRWNSQATLPCTRTETQKITNGYEFYLYSVRAAGVKKGLKNWLNRQIGSFEKSIVQNTGAADDFNRIAKYRFGPSIKTLLSRNISLQVFSCGVFASARCMEDLGGADYFEVYNYTRTWDMKKQREVSLKDLFLPGADYTNAINAYISKKILQQNYLEDMLKRPFTGIGPDYGQFAVGYDFSEGFGAWDSESYGRPVLQILFDSGNPWFAYPAVYSVPLDALSGIINPGFYDKSIEKGFAALKNDDTPAYTDIPARTMPNTHICTVSKRQTEQGGLRREEAYIDKIEDASVKNAVNQELQKYYGVLNTDAIKQMFAPLFKDNPVFNTETSSFSMVSEAKEFGGFLLITCKIYASIPEEEYAHWSINDTMLFDLATGKRLKLSDIVTKDFYRTPFYKRYRDFLSNENFGLSDSGYVSFRTKPGNKERGLYDEEGKAEKYFNWDKWRHIKAMPLE